MNVTPYFAPDPSQVLEVPDFFARNFLISYYYPGMLVRVTADPAATPYGDAAANPTGKVYRLKPLAECSQQVNNYGGEDSHWQIADAAAAAGGDSTPFNGARPITRVVGGLLGVIPGGTTVDQFMENVFYPPPAPVAPRVGLAIVPNSLQEAGTSLTVTLTGSYSIGSDAAPTQGEYRRAGVVVRSQLTNIAAPITITGIDATTTFDFAVAFPGAGVKSASVTVAFVPPFYFGCAGPTAPDGTLLSLTKPAPTAHTAARALAFSGTAGQVFWLLYDPAHSLTTVINKNGFNVTDDWEFVRTVTNSNGITLRAYRLKAANAFATTVTGFTNTFSFA